jgi:hypothetical protein
LNHGKSLRVDNLVDSDSVHNEDEANEVIPKLSVKSKGGKAPELWDRFKWKAVDIDPNHMTGKALSSDTEYTIRI